MLKRTKHLTEIRRLLQHFPVVGVLGARQVGKTTLARTLVRHHWPGANLFDLEDARDVARLTDPLLALGTLTGLTVLDEIQRRPELFPTLRVLADRPRKRTRFLILGSASPELLRQASESLAGRIAYHELGGFSISEVGPGAARRLWLRGGFPRSFLAATSSRSVRWREEFVRTFLERELPQLGVTVPAATLHRFWTMLAHYHGGLWNAAEAARSLGTSEPTARRYLDLVSGLFIVRQLQPWHENLKKRQVKAPKIYLRDSGLLHALLGLATEGQILSHPKLGASWEGYAIEETLKAVRPDAAYFWATHTGAELDLLLLKNGQRYGVEVKFQDAPRFTPSMRIALGDLRLRRLTVVYPGDTHYAIDPRVSVVPLADLAKAGASAVLGREKRSR